VAALHCTASPVFSPFVFEKESYFLTFVETRSRKCLVGDVCRRASVFCGNRNTSKQKAKLHGHADSIRRSVSLCTAFTEAVRCSGMEGVEGETTYLLTTVLYDVVHVRNVLLTCNLDEAKSVLDQRSGIRCVNQWAFFVLFLFCCVPFPLLPLSAHVHASLLGHSQCHSRCDLLRTECLLPPPSLLSVMLLRISAALLTVVFVPAVSENNFAVFSTLLSRTKITS
jgi:hypothetical protein